MNCSVGPSSSLQSSGFFSDVDIAQLWDFYVTKGPSSNQARKLADYSSSITYNALIRIAGGKSEQCLLLKADTMSRTLVDLGFYEQTKRKGKSELKPRESISVDEPRWCALQQYEIRDNDPPRAKSGDSDVLCLLRHIRNSFAHGYTHVLANRMILLCDKDSKPTARVLIKADTLIDWVKYIDIRGMYYFRGDSRHQIKTILGQA